MDRRGRSGGEEGSGVKKEKKSDGTCSFIRPFTPVATATCLEGTPERRRRWQKNNRAGRELVGAAQAGRHSPTRQPPSDQGCSTRRRSRRNRKRSRRRRRRLQTSSRLPLACPPLMLARVGLSGCFFCLRRVMNTHSSAEGHGLSEINAGFDPAEVRPTDQV